MRVQSIAALAVVALAAAACGGGGGGSTPATPANTTGGNSVVTTPAASPVAVATTPASGTGTAATFKVIVPASASSSISRRAQNIAAGSSSISIQLIGSGGVAVTNSAAQIFGITATSPGCTSANSTITCTFSVSAPVGTDVFLAQTYASTNGTGSLLSSGAVQVTVAANASNSATLSLDGTVASVYLASANSYLGSYVDATGRASAQAATRKPATGTGFISSTRIFVIALDNEGNAILNPTTYSTPIVLQQTFSEGTAPTVTLSVLSAATNTTSSTSANYGTVTVNSPSDQITATLINNVANGASEDELAAYLGGAPPAPVGSASPSPSPTGVASLYIYISETQGLTLGNNPWQIVGPSENYIYGGSGTYSISDPSCSGIVTLTLEYNYYISAMPVAAGSCSVTLSDNQGDTPTTVPITVTTTSVTGS